MTIDSAIEFLEFAKKRWGGDVTIVINIYDYDENGKITNVFGDFASRVGYENGTVYINNKYGEEDDTM